MAGRTIDNLGYDASQRYALDQKLLDGQETTSSDAKLIYAKTSIEVTQPLSATEADLGFHGPLKSSSWADFIPPCGFDRPKKLFTYELLPTLGGKEKLETLKQTIAEAFTEKEEDNPSQSKEELWDKEQEKEVLAKEKETLTSLLSCILHLDHCMIYMQAKRSQYHKG